MVTETILKIIFTPNTVLLKRKQVQWPHALSLAQVLKAQNSKHNLSTQNSELILLRFHLQQTPQVILSTWKSETVLISKSSFMIYLYQKEELGIVQKLSF